MIKALRACVIAALMFFAIPGYAYDFEVDGIYYDVISFTDLTCKVVNNGNYNTYSGIIAIPDIVKYNTRELKVTEIGQNAFRECRALKAVTIGDNVVTIGQYAFYSSSVEEVVLGKSVGRLEGSAFHYCKSLTKVQLNENLRYIGSSAFSNTTNLTSLELPEGLTTIEEYAFENTGLQTLIVPSTVTFIGQRAFRENASLVSIDLKANIETIPYECFRRTPQLTSISIPSSVTTVGQAAFEYSGILELNGGEGVRTIVSSAFANTKLQTVNLGPSLKEIASSTFYNSPDIRTVNCYMPEVPTITDPGYELFDGKTYINGVLNVLENDAAVYENAPYWKNFWNISPSLPNTLDIFSFNIYASVSSGNGKVLINGKDVSGTAVKGESSVLFTFVPDFGCKLTGLTLNGEDVLGQVDGNSFVVEKVEGSLNLVVTYSQVNVLLTINSGEEGSVSLPVPYGTILDCSIKAQEDWEIVAVAFNGEEVTSQVNGSGIFTTPALTMDSDLSVSYRSIGGPTETGRVYTNENIEVIPRVQGISIRGAADEDLVEIFTVDGKKVKSTFDKEISLSKGIFIVTVGGETFKVAL